MYHLNLSEQVCVCDITLFDMMSSSCVYIKTGITDGSKKSKKYFLKFDVHVRTHTRKLSLNMMMIHTQY